MVSKQKSVPIRISPRTRKELGKLRIQPSETYDEVINRLLSPKDQNALITRIANQVEASMKQQGLMLKK